MKGVYACIIIIMCSLVLTGFLGAGNTQNTGGLQEVPEQSQVITDANSSVTLTSNSTMTPNYESIPQTVNSSSILPSFTDQSSPQSIALYTETDNSSLQIKVGVNYLSLYHMYSDKYTPDDVLRRDFSRFQRDGVSVICLSLFWYRLEGNTQGDYDGEYLPYPQEVGGFFGERFLDNVKRVIEVAQEYDVKVLLAFNTLWGDDSSWCTPDYVIDPVTGKNIGLAIVRNEDMKQAFIDMFNHTVAYLAGTPGIWAWAILNEPWYWGRTANEHDFVTANGKTQKENFIELIESLSSIVKQYDGRQVTVKFCDTSEWVGKTDGLMHIKNIFVDDWAWEQRIFNALDFICFNAYLPIYDELQSTWRDMTTININTCHSLGKNVWISEFGAATNDSSVQATIFEQSVNFYKTLPINGYSPWYWEGDNKNPATFGFGGIGFNLCADATTGAARLAYNKLH